MHTRSTGAGASRRLVAPGAAGLLVTTISAMDSSRLSSTRRLRSLLAVACPIGCHRPEGAVGSGARFLPCRIPSVAAAFVARFLADASSPTTHPDAVARGESCRGHDSIGPRADCRRQRRRHWGIAPFTFPAPTLEEIDSRRAVLRGRTLSPLTADHRRDARHRRTLVRSSRQAADLVVVREIRWPPGARCTPWHGPQGRVPSAAEWMTRCATSAHPTLRLPSLLPHRFENVRSPYGEHRWPTTATPAPPPAGLPVRRRKPRWAIHHVLNDKAALNHVSGVGFFAYPPFPSSHARAVRNRRAREGASCRVIVAIFRSPCRGLLFSSIQRWLRPLLRSVSSGDRGP